MKRGKCELCHRIRDLHDSHYLPKAGYKSAREGSLANPNPIVLAGGKARHSSVQIRGYKFCTECEGRLNKGGEAWVLKVTPKTYGGKFAIHEMIRDAPVIHMREGFVAPGIHKDTDHRHGKADLFCNEYLLARHTQVERRARWKNSNCYLKYQAKRRREAFSARL
jgi:hypothetical protein